jgi:hypothetical protein
VWRVAGGDALVLAGDGLPAAKGVLRVLDDIDGESWRSGACVLRGASLHRLRERLQLDPGLLPELYAADADVLVVAGVRGGLPVIAHACEDEQRLVRCAERLQCARTHFERLGLATLLPSLIDQAPSAGGVAVLVQQRLPGDIVDASTLSADGLASHVRAALQPLRALQDAGTHDLIADGPLLDALERDLLAVPQWRDAVALPLAALRRWSSQARVASVLAHGDYWLGNLLFGDAGQLCGIIDWERARERTTVGYDAVHLVIHAFARWRGCPEWQVPSMLWDDHCEPVLERLYALVAAQLDMSMNDLRHVALLVWLVHLRQHVATRATWKQERHRDWLEEPALSARRWLVAGGAQAN